MGRIKKLLDREFVGGSTDEEVYPISSTKAIYDSSNTSLDFILKDYLDKINKLSSKVGFYVCDSLSSDPDKEIQVPNFSLDTNIRLIVKMTRANSADNVSFEVNDTGAKLLYYNDELASSKNTWKEGETIDIYYDGSVYRAFHYSGSTTEGEITDSLWTLKEDESGVKYLYTDLNIVVRGGGTFYSSGDNPLVPSIFDNIPIDNDTIYWYTDPETKERYLKAKGGGEGGVNISIIGVGDSIEPTNENVFSSLRTLEEIDKKLIWEVKTDSNGQEYLYSKYPIVGKYGATFYSGDTIEIDSIYSGLPIDNDTIYWEEDAEGNRILKSKGGTGGGVSNWEDLQGKPEWITDTAPNNNIFPNIANYWVTDNDKILSWDNAASKSHEHANKATLDKIYEKDGVIYWDGSLAVTGGITQYALGDTKVSTIMDGVAVDGTTITKEGGVLKVIGGGGSSFDDAQMWKLLGASSAEQINHSHLTTALQGYATTTDLAKKWTQDDTKIANWDSAYNLRHSHENKTVLDSITSIKVENWDTAFGWGNHAEAGYAHLANEETFTGLKHFTKNITVGAGKKSIYEKDGVIYIDADVAVTGGITQYAVDSVDIPTIMDGVAVDGTTIAKVDGVLKVLNAGGGEAGSVAWGNITGKPSVFATNIGSISDLHSSWVAVLKAQKPNYLTAVSIATISDLNNSWDALLKAAPSSYVTRWPSISEVTGKQNLIIQFNGGTTEGTNKFTYNGTTAKTVSITLASIGAAASSHNHSWANITSGKPNTLSGYGITDAYTKTEADNKYLLKTSYTAADILAKLKTVDGSGSGLDADLLDGKHNGNLTSRYWNPTSPVDDLNNYRHNGFAAWNTVSANKPCEYGTLFQFSNQDNPIAGTNDHWVNQIAFGTNNRLYVRQRINNTGSWTSWSSVAYLTDNVASATKLQTTRTIWGQPFDGTKSINGNLTIGSGNSDDKINIYNNSLTDSYCRISNTNTNKTIAFGIGASGINRGIYDISFSKWMIYSDNTKTYLCDNIWINQSGYNNGLYINRTVANLGAAISFYSNNSGLGIIGINGSKTFEFGVLNGTAIDLKFTVDSNGNALACGGITQYSDQRAKTIIEQINLSLMDIANSPAVRFKWNGWKQKDDGKTHIGGIAQYVQNVLPEAIYNSDDVLTMDYATTGYIFAVQTAKHLLDYETKTDREINRLKKRIKQLEKQLKKLGYEEANIMDN